MADDWFKLNMDIFGNRKIKYLRRLPNGDSIALFWIALLAEARRCNSDGKIFLTENIPYSAEMLAEDFKFEESTVKLALETFEQLDMTFKSNGFITIAGWEDHQNAEGLAKIREQNRQRQAKFKAKQKEVPGNVTDNVTVTLGNATEKEIDKDIEKEEENKNGAKQPSMADVNSFFEALWDMYPVKKGKGQVSESKRRTLYAIGFDKLNRAIERYLAELKKDADWRKPQNGSTFFNSGYVDYLDENFVPDQKGRKEKLPGWFGKRELDQDELDAINQLMSEEDQAEAEQLRKELQESFGKG